MPLTRPAAGNPMDAGTTQDITIIDAIEDAIEDATTGHAHTGAAAGGKKVAHTDLSGIGAGDHHAQAHALGGADHTGSLASGQHGDRSAEGGTQHALGQASGTISDTQHGVRTLANAHAHSALSGITANHITSGTLAARPAFGTADRYYYATDGNGTLYRDTGAAWVTVSVMDLASLATRAHSSLTGIGTGDHHAQAHSVIGGDHSGFPGGTTNFLRADGTFAAPPGGGGGPSVLDRVMTDLAFNTSAAENTLYSFSIPGNTIGATGILRCRFIADFLNNTGANQTGTLRIKLGATTIFASGSGNIATNAGRRVLDLDFILANLTTGSQRLGGRAHMGAAGASTGEGDIAATVIVNGTEYGTAAEDTTSAKTLAITWQHAASNASLEIARKMVVLELLP
jgi:hypothetical protein